MSKQVDKNQILINGAQAMMCGAIRNTVIAQLINERRGRVSTIPPQDVSDVEIAWAEATVAKQETAEELENGSLLMRIILPNAREFTALVTSGMWSIKT